MPESASRSAPPVELSVVVPAYDEAESLPVLAREIREVLEPSGHAYEVIFVDDGSTDGTPEVLGRLAEEDRRLRVLRQSPRQGQSAALAAGWGAARAPVVVTLDADLQNDPADIPRLLEHLDRADVVWGVRVDRKDSWIRRLSSRVANRVRNRVVGDSVTDVGCTLRAAKAVYLRRVPVFDGLHRFLPALLERAGARVVEVPVDHRPRRFGRTKYGIGDRLWRGIADLYGVRWLKRRWVEADRAREITPER